LENAVLASQPFSIVLAGSLTVCVAGVAPAVAQEPVTNNLFTAAGFTVQYANTPEKHAILRRLPPDKLVIRRRGDKTYYIYADPSICRCAYVGTPAAYRAYQSGNDESQFLKSEESRGEQTLDEFTEDDTEQTGTTSFNDYVFGGIQDD
jgi:hypothetical protein